jgi:hypothetical protein
MLFLRTASGSFVNAATIVRLSLQHDGEGWLAICGDGKEVVLDRYYSAPGRVEKELPHLIAFAPLVSDACLCGPASDNPCMMT